MAKKYTLSDDLKNTFSNLEQEHGLPSGLLSAVAKTESNYNPNATSPVGAAGMFQFMPGTAKQYGVNVSDPVSSAKGAARMYADLLKANGGDLNRALAGYNWGQGNVQKKGLERAPQETRNYIKRVNENLNSTDYNNTQVAGGDGATATLSNNSTSKPSFDTSAFSLDDLDQPTATEQQGQEQVNNATNPNDPNSGAITKTFDTSAFSLDDLDQPTVATEQKVPAEIVSQQANANNLTSNVNTQRQYDDKDKALIESLGNHQNMGQFLSQVKDDDLKNGTNQYQEIMSSLQRYGQANPQTVDHGWFRTLAGSVANGLNSFKNSAGQLVSRAIGDEESYKNFQNNEKQQEALIDANNALDDRSGTRLTGEIIGQSLPTLAVPGGLATQGISKLGKAGEAIATGLSASKTGRVIGSAATGATGAVIGDGSTANYDNFIEDRAKNAAVGAVAGPIVGGVVNSVARPVAKFISGRTPEEARLAQQEANRNGIQLLNSDLPGISEKGRAIAETAVKDNNEVQKQILKNSDTAKLQLDTLADKASKFDDVSFINKRPAIKQAIVDEKNSYSDEAKKYLDYISTIDNKHDPISALKTVAMGQNLDKKIQASNLYNKAWDSLPQDRESLMNAELTQNALLNFKNLANKSYDKNQRKELLSVYDRFADNDFSRLDPRNIDDFRKALNSVSNDYASNPIANKSANTQIINQIDKVKKALDADTDNFANSINDRDFVSNYKQARAYYAKNVVPLNDGKNSKLFSIDYNNNPNALNNLLKDPYNTKTVMKMLDEEGKQAVQAGALNTLISKSTDNEGVFNPQRFINNYNSYQKKDSKLNPLNEVFGGSDGVSQRVKSLSKIMKNMTSTSTAGKTAQNGYEVYKLLVKHAPKFAGALGAAGGLGAGGLVGAAFAGVGSAAASKAIKNAYAKVLTKPEYSKFMFDFAQTNPKSDYYLKKADKFISILSANGLNEITEE